MHAIIREYDDNGNLINEVFMVNTSNEDAKDMDDLILTEEEKLLSEIKWVK